MGWEGRKGLPLRGAAWFELYNSPSGLVGSHVDFDARHFLARVRLKMRAIVIAGKTGNSAWLHREHSLESSAAAACSRIAIVKARVQKAKH